MAKKIIQMYDKYQSTTKVYPKIIKGCLEEDVQDYIEGQVVANPTLAGTEAELTGLQVGETKYKIGGGKQLYRHNIILSDTNLRLTLNIINDDATPFTLSTLAQYIADKGFTNGLKLYEASGWSLSSGNLYILCGVNNQGTFYATGVDAGTKAGVNYNLANRTLEDIIITL